MGQVVGCAAYHFWASAVVGIVYVRIEKRGNEVEVDKQLKGLCHADST